MDGVRREMQELWITPEDALRTEHSRDQEFGSLTPPNRKKRRRTRCMWRWFNLHQSIAAVKPVGFIVKNCYLHQFNKYPGVFYLLGATQQ